MEHEDCFCPECGANIGPGTLEILGCPLCGYEEFADDEEEEEFFEEEE